MHCVNCVDSEVCVVVSAIRTCVVMVTVCVLVTVPTVSHEDLARVSSVW